MKERPIIFSGPMVQAILDGSKTQTRRVVKQATCPYGETGDHLWVREKWGWSTLASMQPHPDYPQFLMFPNECPTSDGFFVRWRPSIHMPRWASRITLEITGVRVERLQDITREDALAEGIIGAGYGPNYDFALFGFQQLWNSIYDRFGLAWSANPGVWVIEFRRIKP